MELLKDEKKVLVPWDEYQRLLEDSKALKVVREELKKDCEERGLYVERKVVFCDGAFFGGPLQDINPRISIASKDEVLKAAQEEIEYLDKQVKEMEKTIDRLKNRNLWDRIFNK